MLESWQLSRIAEELDLTTPGGLYYASLFGAGFMIGARPNELTWTNRGDFGLSFFAKGVDWSPPFSKTDQDQVGTIRGIKHRPGCACDGEPRNGVPFCVACCVAKYLALTSGEPTDPMWPAFSGGGAVSGAAVGAALRQAKINAAGEFVRPGTKEKVVISLKKLMGSSFRRSGAQAYLKCKGATTSGAMWWGRWVSPTVFELYAHDLAMPLSDPANRTDQMYDVECVRVDENMSEELADRLLAATIKVAGAAEAMAAAATAAQKPPSSGVEGELRAQLAELTAALDRERAVTGALKEVLGGRSPAA